MWTTRYCVYKSLGRNLLLTHAFFFCMKWTHARVTPSIRFCPRPVSRQRVASFSQDGGGGAMYASQLETLATVSPQFQCKLCPGATVTGMLLWNQHRRARETLTAFVHYFAMMIAARAPAEATDLPGDVLLVDFGLAMLSSPACQRGSAFCLP